MKSAYVICILLSITISYLTLANAGVTPHGTQIFDVTNKNETTTALPSTSTSSIPSSSMPATTASVSNSTTPNVTTPIHTTTAIPTTHPPTSPTTTSKSTSAVPTTVKPTVTTSTVPKSTPEATTTAVPSPSKDRHFDGLSFFGGIILATCLMAIAVFSWKFYRQCNQENYRTL